MAASSPAKPRPRKRAASSASGNGQVIEGEIVGDVVDIKPDGAARRIFRGVRLPDRPIFTLESASDPDNIVEFTGVAALPGLPAMRLVTDGISIDTLPSFFGQILGAEQYEKFEEFANEPDNGITLDVLVELAKYLLEIYTGRPTLGSSGS